MTNFYVSVNGVDTAKGTSETTPFRTIQKAINLAVGGDTVYVMNGDYTTNGGIISVVNKHCSPDKPLTIQAFPNHKPKLIANAKCWNAIYVGNSSYIVIDGFTVQGNSDNVTLEYAKTQQTVANPATNCNGVYLESKPNAFVHHITVKNCDVYKFPGAGITTKDVDYIRIENNKVHECLYYNIYGCNPISLLRNYNYDQNTTDYRNFLINNVVYNNISYIPWREAGKVTEGHGLMIDCSNSGGFDNERYTGRTLIANNLSYGNGGSGIQVLDSDNVDVINNTCYKNCLHPNHIKSGEILINQGVLGCSYLKVIRNIMYSNPTGIGINLNNYGKVCKNNIFDFNLVYGTSVTEKSATNYIFKDPLFTDEAKFDFTLKADSPAKYIEQKQRIEYDIINHVLGFTGDK